jgi:phage-related protein
MADFPTLAEGQDSSLYEVQSEDPVVRTELEGGYVSSRPRHTRTPRKTYKTGFTRIGTADKALLDAFWTSVRGGSLQFNWTDPVTLAVIVVRFTGGPLNYKYAGIGNVHHWNVTFSLEQV